MINILLKNKKHLYKKLIIDIKKYESQYLLDNAVWIDLIKPNKNEERVVEGVLKIATVNKKKAEKIEIMNHCYIENSINYMTIITLDKNSQYYPDTTAITFILSINCLITIRYDKFKFLECFNLWVTKKKRKIIIHYIIINTLDSIIMNNANTLEDIGNDIDNILKIVFKKSITKKKKSSHFYNEIVKEIGYLGNIISKNRESLVSINRMLLFFNKINKKNDINTPYKLKLKNFFKEVVSLTEYANFLLQRNGFLLDATLGMISVEQNLIIKIFTVASAVFMPPMLIASIYGMNFNFIPELNYILGYPICLVIIVISGILPYLFFKKKEWI